MSTPVPPIIVYTENNDFEGVKKCISDGCNIDEQRQDGRSALLVACLKGYLEITKLLIDSNANVFIKNRKGGNALGHAAYKNHKDIVDLLLEKKADPNEQDNTGRNTLHIACSQGCNEVIATLLDKKAITDINAKTADGRDVLALAINGKCSVLTFAKLVVYGASMTVFDEMKHNLLHQAVLKDNLEIVDFLYHYSDINLNMIDAKGNTCIHLACQIGSRRLITYLIYHGAMINCRNKEGLFPDSVATSYGHEDIAEYIHTIIAPPLPPTTINTFKADKKNDVMLQLEYAAQPNYYPHVESVEIQIKQNKFFDSWKTVCLQKASEAPYVPNEEKERIETIDFDTKCGVVEKMDDAVVQFMKENEEKVIHRSPPTKQWVAPPSLFVVDDLANAQNYVVRARCGTKYGWGNYSNSVVIDPIANGGNKVKQLTEIKKRGESNDSSSDSDSSDEPTTEVIDEKEIQRLLDESINTMKCIMDGGVSVLTEQIGKGCDVASLRNANGMNLLHVAASNGKEEIVKYLVQNRILDVNSRSEVKTIALHHAIYGGHVNVVKYLIEAGSDPAAKDTSGINPFLLAIVRGNMELSVYFMSTIPRKCIDDVDNLSRNALVLAINNKDLHMADYLLQNGFSMDYCLPPPRGWNMLYFAVATKDIPTIQYCLDHGISPCAKVADSSCAVDYSVSFQASEVTSLLNRFAALPRVAEIDDVESNGTMAVVSISLPPLDIQHILFSYQYVEVSYKKATFLAVSSIERVELTGSQQNPALEESIVFNLVNLTPDTSYQCKVRLCNRNGMGSWSKPYDFRVTNSIAPEERKSLKLSHASEGMSPRKRSESSASSASSSSSSSSASSASSASSKSYKSQKMGAVVAENSTQMEVMSQPLNENEPPSSAIIVERVKLYDVDFICSLPSSIDLSSIVAGDMPLLHLCIMNSATNPKKAKEMMKVLIERGSNKTQEANGLTPLLCCCLQNDSSYLKLILSQIGLEARSTIAGIPDYVFYSLLAPSSACLLTLLSNQVSIETRGWKNRSLLHILCCCGRERHFYDIAFELLNKGIDINGVDDDLNTPLHLSVIYNNPSMIVFLLTHGASLTIKNKNSLTPKELAEQLNNEEAIHAFSAVLSVPYPPPFPQVYLLEEKEVLIKWDPPMYRNGVPTPSFYEVQVTNLDNGQFVSLGDKYTATSYVFANPYQSAIAVRIRAKNCNGWSEWSDRGYVVGKCPEEKDMLYIWLFHLSLEQYYPVMMLSGVSSIQDVIKLSASDIAKLRMKPLHEKQLMDSITRITSRIQNESSRGNEKGSKDSKMVWFRS